MPIHLFSAFTAIASNLRKFLSAKIIFSPIREFSPSKVSRYTVVTDQSTNSSSPPFACALSEKRDSVWANGAAKWCFSLRSLIRESLQVGSGPFSKFYQWLTLDNILVYHFPGGRVHWLFMHTPRVDFTLFTVTISHVDRLIGRGIDLYWIAWLLLRTLSYSFMWSIVPVQIPVVCMSCWYN